MTEVIKELEMGLGIKFMGRKIVCPIHGETSRFLWFSGIDHIPPENKYCEVCVVNLVYDLLLPAPLVEQNNLLKAPQSVSKDGTGKIIEREVLDPYIYGDPIKQKTKAEFNRWGKKISGSVKKGWKRVFG